MNKQAQLKSLTWKYFWRNKILELIGLLVLIVLVLLFPTIGKLFGCWEEKGEGSLMDSEIIDDGVCDNYEYGLQGFAIVFGLAVVTIIMWGFIRLNWSFADTEARTKLNNWD